jgi:predicted metalloprotease
MQFDDQKVDVSGVDDRRGRGGGAIALGGGGLGVVGLIVYLLINVLGGGSGTSGLPGAGGVDVGGTGETGEQLSARCNTGGAIDKYDDCYLIKVYGEINEVWTASLQGYHKPKLGFFEQAVQTGCGPASSDVGPFYCPPDQEIYIDIGFLKALQSRFGAQGRYAQAYILAHETGHHLQSLLGTEQRIRQQMQADPSRRNALSITMELQADCYAGVWSTLADRAGNVSITQNEVDQALNAAQAVGDDRIQKTTTGRVNPESWTHGSAAQRRAAFQRGFSGGSVDSCQVAGT